MSAAASYPDNRHGVTIQGADSGSRCLNCCFSPSSTRAITFIGRSIRTTTVERRVHQLTTSTYTVTHAIVSSSWRFATEPAPFSDRNA
jgi:hypothetical protein